MIIEAIPGRLDLETEVFGEQAVAEARSGVVDAPGPRRVTRRP